MSQFTGLKSYPVSVASQDIPAAWLSNSDPRVAPCNKKIVSIASQNGDQGPSGTLSFLLPSNMGAGMLASGSAYIRATIKVNQVTAAGFNFKQYGSASSIINRATFLASGAIVEQILNYNKLYSSLLLHASSPQYATNDDKVSQCTFSGATADGGQFAADVVTVQVCVPILLGAFNSKQHLPLFLLSAAQLNIDLETLNEAICQVSANAVSNYTVSNAQLVFEQLNPDSQYEMGMKQMLGQRLFQMPINTFYNVKVGAAAGSSITQNIGLNCSSLRGILWNQVLNADAVLIGSGAFVANGQSQAQVYLDGQLAFQGNLDTTLATGNPQQCYMEMNRAFNIMYDSNIVSCAPTAYTTGDAVANDFTLKADGITRALYVSGAYLGGVSTQKSSDGGFSFVGVPCNTAVLQLTGNTGASTVYIYCALQQVITIDQAGSASLVR
jgi:hypothetical protein